MDLYLENLVVAKLILRPLMAMLWVSDGYSVSGGRGHILFTNVDDVYNLCILGLNSNNMVMIANSTYLGCGLIILSYNYILSGEKNKLNAM